MMWGATRCTLFHTELGVMSGPGADDGDDRARALLISSASKPWQSANGRRMVSLGPEGSPGKKWSRRALLSAREGAVFSFFLFFFISYIRC